jgi:HEAT repeat protein
MELILKKLKGNDRRSIGRSNEVVKEVLANPSLFGALLEGMLSQDPIIRMRAADAVEKITSKHPELLQPYKSKIIQQVSKIEQQEVRWHVAQLFSRLLLTHGERRGVVGILNNFMKDKSKIVRTFSMQALADIAEKDAGLREPIIEQLEELTRTGSPAMKSRGKKLLAKLKRSTMG